MPSRPLATFSTRQARRDLLVREVQVGDELYRLPTKALIKERAVLRALTSRRLCFKPLPDLIEDLNQNLQGWAAYFSLATRDLPTGISISMCSIVCAFICAAAVNAPIARRRVSVSARISGNWG